MDLGTKYRAGRAIASVVHLGPQRLFGEICLGGGINLVMRREGADATAVSARLFRDPSPQQPKTLTWQNVSRRTTPEPRPSVCSKRETRNSCVSQGRGERRSATHSEPREVSGLAGREPRRLRQDWGQRAARTATSVDPPGSQHWVLRCRCAGSRVGVCRGHSGGVRPAFVQPGDRRPAG